MTKLQDSLAKLQAEAKDRAQQQEIKDLKRREAHWKKMVEEIDKQLGVALSLRHRMKAKPPVIKACRPKVSESVAVVAASCWHVEENVDPKVVNGINSFNLEIADARITKLFQHALRLVEIERNGTDVDTLVFALLGDLMTGYIHEELLEGNDLSPTETILWLQKRIIGGLKFLREKGGFKKIIVPCCIGNHGRTTAKKRVATAYKNSFEWLMYHILADAFDNSEGTPVEFAVGNSYFNYLQVYEKTLRFHHGDNLSYQGGVGGISIPVNKAIAAWDKTRHADLDIFGHWHQTLADRKWVSTGSLIGYNAYALSIKAVSEPPQQSFFLFEKNRGRTVTTPITLN
jgi:hypothetical protein